jgi:protein-tyrosine phosphatase
VIGDERHVPFEAAFNFRDLGGYETADGRRVCRGAVYRSDTLHRLTTADLELATRIGIRTVIDLRTADELAHVGSYDRASDVEFHHLPLEDAIPQELPPRDTPEPPPGETYVEMAVNGRHAVANTLRVIAEGEHAVVFHCYAGKDRTGIIAALVLAALGVPDETIVADYHLTEQALPRAVAWAEEHEPEWVARMANFPPWLLAAPPATMEAFLEILRDRHGSIEGYLADAGAGAGVISTLRSRLLEA